MVCTIDTIDFREEVINTMATNAARQIVHDILYEEEYHDEDCAYPELYYRFDNSIVIRNDPYERVALVPRAKQLIQKALVDDLKDLFVDVMHNTIVKLLAARDGERLQFTADLNLSDEQQMWKNVKIDILRDIVEDEHDRSRN